MKFFRFFFIFFALLVSRHGKKIVKRIYLDANGSSPACLAAKEKIAEIIHLIGNPSSSHEHGRVMRTLLDEARGHIAHALNALPKEIIFTSGASESNRLFVDALSRWAEKLGRPLQILMSPFEHPSLYKPILAHEAFRVEIIPTDKAGALSLARKLSHNIDVFIASHAHNETGIVNDIDGLVRAMSPDVLVMSDVSQAFARLPPLSDRVDVMTFSAQKMGAFAGAGGMLLRGNARKLAPPWLGGGQERGFRPGTESVILLSAFGEAAKHVETSRDGTRYLCALRDRLEARLLASAPALVIGCATDRLANTSAMSFYAEDADALRIACDLAGLSVGFGAACSGLAPEGSFALKRLGLSRDEERTTVRFSLPLDCCEDDIDEAVRRILQNVLTKQRSHP
jgi:cysteine desulfurase